MKGNLLFRSFPLFAVFIAERKGKQWLRQRLVGTWGNEREAGGEDMADLGERMPVNTEVWAYRDNTSQFLKVKLNL